MMTTNNLLAKNKADRVLGVKPVQPSLLLGPDAAPTKDDLDVYDADLLPDSFELQGYRFYRQGRKCNKDGCRCQDGDLHGPYWFRRDQVKGTVKYIGTNLPDPVVWAYWACRKDAGAIVADIRELKSRLSILTKLQNQQRLTPSERMVLRELGYRECLINVE